MTTMPTEPRSRIFAAYIGSEIQCRKKCDHDKDYLFGISCEVTLKSNHGDWVKVWFKDVHSVTDHNWSESSSNQHTFFFGEDECSLLLTSLEDITDEDAIEVAKLIFGASYNSNKSHADLVLKSCQAKEFVLQLSKTPLTGIETISIIDYLRSRHYALPFAGHSVSELIEAGVFTIKK